jgi:hypothetical protein
MKLSPLRRKHKDAPKVGHSDRTEMRQQTKPSVPHLIIRRVRIRLNTRTRGRIGIDWSCSRLSAHSQMRRTFSFAFLLLAVWVASSAYATGQVSQAHRKASTSAHRSSHSRSSAASHQSVRRTRSRSSVRASVRTAKYTPKRSYPHPAVSSAYSPAPAASSASSLTASSAPASASSGYSADYRNGFAAGRAAALKELANQSADAKLASQPAAPASAAYPANPNPAALHPAASGTSAKTPPMSPGELTKQPVSATAAAPVSGASDADQLDDEDTPATAKTNRAAAADDYEPPPTEVAALRMPSGGMPVSLRGSLASLERQNTMLDAEGMERILDEDDLSSRVALGLLVPLPVSANLTVNPNLIENHRYCRPWTARFLSDLARAHQAEFHRPLQVNSAVRTVDYQKRLMRINGNAAAAEGDIVSPHLTGATIDIGKQGMSRAEKTWMRQHLMAIQQASKIDVEEEFRQSCFHITVYKTYTAASPHKTPQPAVRDASDTHEPAPTSSRRRGNSLPSSIATGTFTLQSH